MQSDTTVVSMAVISFEKVAIIISILGQKNIALTVK